MHIVRIQDCRLYYVRDNQLISKAGEVYINETYRSAKFVYDSYFAQCAMEAGEFRYGKLWLPNRDDGRAKELLIKYHESRIEALRKQIESHELTIRNLKGECK